MDDPALNPDARVLRMVDQYGDIVSVSRSWLDEEIRSGHFSPHTGIQYAPWTGEAFVAIGELPAFAEVWTEPNAAFTRHLLRRRPAWLAHGVSSLILLAGLVQLMGFFGVAPGFISSFFDQGATGFEALLLEGRILAPWSSQLIHGSPDHLLMNLAVVGYCGYRVERALGWSGYAAVAAAGVLGGSLAITCFEGLPVIGSSILGFAVWGAQIAIGFRYGNAIPPLQRKFYGYGNLLAFAVLFVGTLRSDAVSHWGHVGGFAGGVVVAMTLAPALGKRGPKGVLLRVAAISLVTLALGPLIRLVPPLAWGPTQSIELEETGLVLDLPSRLLPDEGVYEYVIMREPAWKTSWASDEAIYSGLSWQAERALRDGDLLLGADFVVFLSEQYAIDAVEVPSRPPLGPGWTVTTVEFVDEGNGDTYRIEEHHLARGRYLTRLGTILRVEDGATGPRGELFDGILRSAAEGELPTVRAARSEVGRNPTSRRLRLELAGVLADAGETDEADALYAELVDPSQNYGGDAITNRVWMWGHLPAAFEPDGPPWFAEWVEVYSDDRTLQLNAVRWYAHHGLCDEATRLDARLFDRRPELTATLAAMETALQQAQCGMRRSQPSDGDAEG